VPEPKRIEPHALRDALGLVLAPPRGAANPAQVRTFLAYLTQTGIRWEAWQHADRGASRAVLLTLWLPGRTASLLLTHPTSPQERDGLRDLLAYWRERAQATHLHYAQALIEPEADGKRDVLLQTGFTRLTRLAYLERDARFPWCDPPEAPGLEWLPYTPERQERFARVIEATYADSLDCPELTGLRPIEDVLASHRASGPFDPRLWELAYVQGVDAGCLLLTRVPGVPALEVVYMGVVAAQRRRGIGALLLRRALQQARQRGIERVTLVVDERNRPARRLYDRFSFGPVTERDAYWLRLAGLKRA